MPEQKATRAERLHAIVRKVNPKLADQHKASGRWDGRTKEQVEEEERRLAADPKARHAPGGAAGAPYQIRTLTGNGRRVLVTSADGDVLGGNGDTLDAAIAALEKKVGLAGQEE